MIIKAINCHGQNIWGGTGYINLNLIAHVLYGHLQNWFNCDYRTCKDATHIGVELYATIGSNPIVVTDKEAIEKIMNYFAQPTPLEKALKEEEWRK